MLFTALGLGLSVVVATLLFLKSSLAKQTVAAWQLNATPIIIRFYCVCKSICIDLCQFEIQYTKIFKNSCFLTQTHCLFPRYPILVCVYRHIISALEVKHKQN